MSDILSTKVFSHLQENLIANYLNWGGVSGSGSRAGRPGDIIGAHFLGECKTHKEPGHKIAFNAQVWKKIQNEAQSIFKFPVLFVDDGSQRVENTWCLFTPFVVPEYGKFVDFDVDTRVNLIFDGAEASKKYAQEFYSTVGNDEEFFGVFTVHLAGETLCMCPLLEFRSVFEDL